MPKQSKVIKEQETLRFSSEEERSKLQAILDRARKNNGGYAPKQHVLKQLLGFPPEDECRQLVTEQDRSYLSGSLDALPEAKDFSMPSAKPKITVRRIKSN